MEEKEEELKEINKLLLDRDAKILELEKYIKIAKRIHQVNIRYKTDQYMKKALFLVADQDLQQEFNWEALQESYMSH